MNISRTAADALLRRSPTADEVQRVLCEEFNGGAPALPPHWLANIESLACVAVIRSGNAEADRAGEDEAHRIVRIITKALGLGYRIGYIAERQGWDTDMRPVPAHEMSPELRKVYGV